MFGLYIIGIGIFITLLGILNIIYIKINKVKRSNKLGRKITIIGVVFILIGGLIYGHYTNSRKLVKQHQDRMMKEQLYDDELIHLDQNSATLKDGKAYITMYVARKTVLKVHNTKKLVQDSFYKSRPNLVRVRMVFIVPGEYRITAIRGSHKVIKKINIKGKNNIKDSSESVSTISSSISSVTSVDSSDSDSVNNSSSVDNNSIVEQDNTSNDSNNMNVVPENNPGNDPGNDPGNNPGNDPGNDPGNNPDNGSDSSSDNGSNVVPQ